MSRFTEFKTRVAGKIVTRYYSRAYEKAVAKADARHAKEGEMIYVIDHFVRGELLSTINRKQFRKIKHAAQELHKNELFRSGSYNTDMLKEQCWYHTPDRGGNNALSAKEREVRRIAFIRMGLKKARLYE